jgi:hypothetical protein
MRLHISDLPFDARGEVVRAFFSIMSIMAISRTSRPLYRLRSKEASYITANHP